MKDIAPEDPLARALLDRARDGDRDAFAALYQTHAKAVFGLTLRLTGNLAKAEDVTQETFLNAMRDLRGYRGDAPVAAWLKRMAANGSIDVLRAESRSRSLDPASVETLLPPANDVDSSLHDCLGALRRLRPEARVVAWLHTVEGWSHPELAARFGRSESWSKSLLARSLHSLRKELEDPCHAQC